MSIEYTVNGEIPLRQGEEDPEEWGFEFMTDGDGLISGEGARDDYYVWRYPEDKLPEAFTARVYIFAPETCHGCDLSEIVGYRGLILDPTVRDLSAVKIHDSDDDGDLFATVAECVAWLNEQIGGPVIKKEAA